MPIKVLIKRQFKEGHVNEIKTMLKEVRYDAMDQEGYISLRLCGIIKIHFELW
jgi:hypothetical protein